MPGWRQLPRYQLKARRHGRSRPITLSSAVSARGGRRGIARCSASAQAYARRVAARERARSRASACSRVWSPSSTPRELAAGLDAEVERGADALAGERQAVAGAVADEEHAVLGRGAQPVREPVALVADGVAVEAARRCPSSAP